MCGFQFRGGSCGRPSSFWREETERTRVYRARGGSASLPVESRRLGSIDDRQKVPARC